MDWKSLGREMNSGHLRFKQLDKGRNARNQRRILIPSQIFRDRRYQGRVVGDGRH
jgi:hypothetical protein